MSDMTVVDALPVVTASPALVRREFSPTIIQFLVLESTADLS